jgi:hypothetical protein
MEELFEKFNDDFLKFGQIKNPRHPRPDICAFLMLHDLCPSNHDMVTSAEHDEIWLDVREDELAKVITRDQIHDLVRCGVRCGDNSYLAMFV